MRVDCGPGTYIRSLARDLGARLGCPSSLMALRRIGSGVYSTDDAVLPDRVIHSDWLSLEQLLARMHESMWISSRLPVSVKVSACQSLNWRETWSRITPTSTANDSWSGARTRSAASQGSRMTCFVRVAGFLIEQPIRCPIWSTSRRNLCPPPELATALLA